MIAFRFMFRRSCGQDVGNCRRHTNKDVCAGYHSEPKVRQEGNQSHRTDALKCTMSCSDRNSWELAAARHAGALGEVLQ